MDELPLIARARSFGERIAVYDSAQPRTYRDLLDRSAEVAGALLQNDGDLAEARVGFLLPAGFEYVAAQWGIWRAGGIAVPLSMSATESELAYTLEDSQATSVVCAPQCAMKVAPVCERLRLRLFVDDLAAPAKTMLPAISPGRRAMILYTSGTTSKPKGVVTTHACIQAQIESLVEAWRWRADDRIPLFLPLHHIHGIVNVMLCSLWSGAEFEPFARFDAAAIFARVAARAYTVFMAVPTIYVKLIEALEALSRDERSAVVAGFRDMRLMVSGSAALPASVHVRWTELTGQQLLERYGMTEIGMALSNPYAGERRPGAVGQPLPKVEVRLVPVDGDAADGAGEIQVRGPTVFREYWNRPEATRASFVDGPDDGSDDGPDKGPDGSDDGRDDRAEKREDDRSVDRADMGWFRTGDMAVLENGYYRILGRTTVDIIKSGGYKLSALEIEAALLDHPAIRECAVVGLPDDTWGEIVAAAAVLQEGEDLDLDALRAWCKDRLSSYKIPRLFRAVDQLPRNAMGKVTKPEVRTLF